MLESILLIIAFGFWASFLWRSAPPIMTEAEMESEEFCYSYTTTPQRRFVVMFGACLSFALFMWLISYAITYFIWQELLSSFFSNEILVRYIFLAIVVVALFFFVRLPGVSRFIMTVCVFFQRCQFFPMLPSPREEKLMEQIAELPLGVLPKEVEEVLSKKHEGQTQNLKDKSDLKKVYDDYYRLEVIVQELSVMAKKRSGFVKRFYFGSEWELIQNLFKVIDRQMNSNTDDLDDDLISKLRMCLFYSYGLLTRVIIETSNSNEESKALFQHYGFDVKM